VSIADPFVLAPGTIFTAIGDLPEPVREQLREQFGQRAGYTLTQPLARRTSTLVDDETAELLREFGTPSTIVDVVIRYSRPRGLDPERVLEDSFPTLRRCLEEGYLVLPGTERARPRAATFAVGDRVAGGVVLRCLHSLEDSEIYQLAMDGGALAALKVQPSSGTAAGHAAFLREAAVLRHLAEGDAPRLLRVGSDAGVEWLLLEWCEGASVGVAAASLRRSTGPTAELLALCRRVVQAYARLHANGVVHGDVHPGNLIVSPAGAVRIVDFGIARGAALAGQEPPRGAAPPYIAPDQARAMLAGAVPGPATEASDQYCLAALLYELLTGHGYLEFALDEHEMLRQIAEDPPLPFTRVGCPSWPEVEEPLRAALAKDPADRLASVAELDRRLGAAGRSGPVVPGTVVGVDRLLETVLADARPGGRWFTGGLPTAPLVSVTYGSAGLAVALHHVATIRDDPELAALADEWALRASADAARDGAFQDRSMELTEAVTGRVTPFHRLSGVHAVQALVSHSLDNAEARQAALDGYVTESRQQCQNIDLVLGRCGTLLGAAILHQAVGRSSRADLTELRTLGNDTLRDIWTELDTLPPIADGTRLRYLGMAHGWAGFLLATLRWCDAADVPRPAAVEERLAQLAELARPEGVSLRWPCTNEGTPSMPGWCNGSTGYVHLWTAAHSAFRDDQWYDLAERAAWDVYLTPAIAQLCCGLAGQAYGLLELYRHTGERRWLIAATELTVRAAADVTADAADNYVPGSLHKGELGVAVLAADLSRPEAASMPFFGTMR
jgi:eukaryotic-like serine/threonine-protein kinase